MNDKLSRLTKFAPMSPKKFFARFFSAGLVFSGSMAMVAAGVALIIEFMLNGSFFCEIGWIGGDC